MHKYTYSHKGYDEAEEADASRSRELAHQFCVYIFAFKTWQTIWLLAACQNASKTNKKKCNSINFALELLLKNDWTKYSVKNNGKARG